jgi:hypothetical protein
MDVIRRRGGEGQRGGGEALVANPGRRHTAPFHDGSSLTGRDTAKSEGSAIRFVRAEGKYLQCKMH